VTTNKSESQHCLFCNAAALNNVNWSGSSSSIKGGSRETAGRQAACLSAAMV